jgi:hypothetical protein
MSLNSGMVLGLRGGMLLIVLLLLLLLGGGRAGEQERVWCGCDGCEEGGDGLCSGKKKMGEDDACCWSSFAMPLDGETS